MPPSPTPAPEAALVRAVGTRGLTAMVVNGIVGAGIFVLPAAVAADLGAAAPVAYLICAIIMGMVTLCFAAAGSRVSKTGGPYMYVEAAFGPRIGFMAGSLFWLSNVLAGGGIAAALTDVLGTMSAPLAQPHVRSTLIVLLYAVVVLTNVRGVRAGTRLVEFMTIAKLLPLVLFVLVGAFFVRPEQLHWTMTPSIGEIGRTAVLLVFAFSGMEVALAPSGEVRDPARTVPRALLLALLLVVTLYIAIQFTAQGLLGSALAGSKAALADAGGVISPTAGSLVAAGAALSMFGYLSGDVLCSSRLLFAFARDGVLPGRLATIHPRFRTPYLAIVLHASVACALALSGTFVRLAILSSVAIIVLYLACCAAAWELRRRDVQTAGTPFTLPGGALIPTLASLALLWVLFQSTIRETLVVAATLIVALGIYQVSRIGRSRVAGERLTAESGP